MAARKLIVVRMPAADPYHAMRIIRYDLANSAHVTSGNVICCSRKVVPSVAVLRCCTDIRSPATQLAYAHGSAAPILSSCRFKGRDDGAVALCEAVRAESVSVVDQMATVSSVKAAITRSVVGASASSP